MSNVIATRRFSDAPISVKRENISAEYFVEVWQKNRGDVEKVAEILRRNPQYVRLRAKKLREEYGVPLCAAVNRPRGGGAKMTDDRVAALRAMIESLAAETEDSSESEE